jgi:hypothetical protein
MKINNQAMICLAGCFETAHSNGYIPGKRFIFNIVPRYFPIAA